MNENTSDTSEQTSNTLNPLGTEEGVVLLAQQKKNTGILWGITALLLIIATAVFFILPDFIVTPQPESGIEASTPTTESARPAIQELSPFDEAQRMRQREAAQAVLADLLSLQESLDQQQVETWALEDYQAALVHAANGDEAYREQRFVEAESSYELALANLQLIQAGIPELIVELISMGNTALNEGDSNAALSHFEQVVDIDPDNEAGSTGVQRAMVLDEVLTIMNNADDARESADFELAGDYYQNAYDLDPAYSQAAEGIKNIANDILERNFQQHMSQGYAALQTGNSANAEDYFKQALALRPGATEASTALDQVTSKVALDTISTYIREARAYISDEKWQQALDSFNAALSIDPALVDAKNGHNEAQSRLNLDNYLVALLADPLGLADANTYQQSLEVYTNTLLIPDGGQRLREQMGQAKNYLEKIRQPVTLTLLSDGQTTVTLLRIESLGEFTNRTLTLTPGRYAATGYRTGYKDIRIEFEIGFDEVPQPITVEASEPVR